MPATLYASSETCATSGASGSWKVVNLLTDWEGRQREWDDFVLHHPKGSIFHTSHMIRVFQAAKGHTTLPLAAISADRRILAMLIAVRVQTLPDPFGRVASRSIFYAEPLCNAEPGSVDALMSLIAEHDRCMRRRVLFTEVRPLSAAGPERAALERSGYQYLDYLNYIVDLAPPLEILWTKLRKSARRAIRRCEERGYQMRELATPDGVDVLYRLLERVYGNARVPLADRSLFQAAFAELHSAGMIKLLAAYEADSVVAVDALLLFKDRVLAWYGGSERLSGISPLDYLQWKEIAWAREQGYGSYDFGGAGWADEPYGVRDYKAKFGGDLVSFGRYRKLYSSWKMALAQRAFQIGRGIISPK